MLYIRDFSEHLSRQGVDVRELVSEVIGGVGGRPRSYYMDGYYPDSLESICEHPLGGMEVLILSFEPSTRTIVAFELAAKLMGATVVKVVDVDGVNTSRTKGETKLEVLRTYLSYGFDIIVVRGLDLTEEEAGRFSMYRCVLVNAGNSSGHPAQALSDINELMYIACSYFKSRYVKVLFIGGDAETDRVAISLRQLEDHCSGCVSFLEYKVESDLDSSDIFYVLRNRDGVPLDKPILTLDYLKNRDRDSISPSIEFPIMYPGPLVPGDNVLDAELAYEQDNSVLKIASPLDNRLSINKYLLTYVKKIFLDMGS